MPPAHPLSDASRCVSPNWPNTSWSPTLKGSFLDSLILRAAADVGQPLKLRVRVNGFETAARMVEASLGIAFVPENCAERYVKVFNVVSVPLDEEWATRHWRLCTRDTGRPAAPGQGPGEAPDSADSGGRAIPCYGGDARTLVRYAAGHFELCLPVRVLPGGVADFLNAVYTGLGIHGARFPQRAEPGAGDREDKDGSVKIGWT